LLVAMSTALRAAPCGRRRAAGNITAELQRAPSRRFFLEHLARRFLDRLLALLAGLRGGTMERSFGFLRGRRRWLRGRGGRCRFCRFRGLRFGGDFGGGFLGFAFFFRFALDRRFLLLLQIFLLARDQFVRFALLGFARRDFLGRDDRRRRRLGRFFDDRRRNGLSDFFVTAHEHALLAHFDLDRARLAGRIGRLDLRCLPARERDSLLAVASCTVLLAQVIEQARLVLLGEPVSFALAGDARRCELLQQRAGGHFQLSRECFDRCLRHSALQDCYL